MPNIAIITDSTAQFPYPNFQGKDLVRLIPMDIMLDGKLIKHGENLKPGDFPTAPQIGRPTKLVIPSVNEISELFVSLLRNFNELLVIVNSAHLSSTFERAKQAVELIQGETVIQVINSQTIAAGLGILVQSAAEMVGSGSSLTDTEREIRQLIPHIFSLFCVPGMRYLYNIGVVEYAQAVIGEILNMNPIYSLEEGIPKAMCKVRNFRHAQEYFQEFIEEFEELNHIAILKGNLSQSIDNRNLRQFVQEYFPDTPFSEHRLNPFLSSILGPRTLGLIVVEKPFTLSG